jgi:3'-5' exoribonuclease
MSRLNVTDLQAGMRLQKSPFLLAVLEEATDRNSNSYLKITLRDKTGDIEARYWRVPSGVAERLSVGEGVAVTGQVEDYRGVLQIKVNGVFPCELEDKADYMPSSRRPREELIDELQRLISSIKNPHLKRLLKELLGSPDAQSQFFDAPAAKVYHHACVGGLLEHSLDVARQVVFVARRYPELDRDLGATVALLHDIGKVDSYESQGAFDFTDVGRLLGHIYIGAAHVDRAISQIEGFPEELRMRVIHAILAHHGEQEKGSPVTPRTPEAIVLHNADNLDGSLRGWVDYVSREPSAGQLSGHAVWTSRSRMHDGELYIGRNSDRTGGDPALEA